MTAPESRYSTKAQTDDRPKTQSSSDCRSDSTVPAAAEIDWPKRCRRIELLFQASQVVHDTLDPQEALQKLICQTVQLLHASCGCIALINPTTGFLEIEVAHALPPKSLNIKLRLGESIIGWVARTGQSLRVGNVRQDPRYLRLWPKVQSSLTVPLVSEGNLIGVLDVESSRSHAFTAQDLELLEQLAPLTVQVIRNTWRFEQLRLKARLFESLVNVSQAINSSLQLDEVLENITRQACQLMEAKVGSLLMLDEKREWLELRASHGATNHYRNKPRLSLNDSLVGVVVRLKKPIQVENVQASNGYQSVDIARREGLVSLLSVPLVFQSMAMGALCVYTGQPHSFSNEEIRVLNALADLSAVAIQKAQLYERIVNIEEQLRQNEKLSALGLLAAEVAHEIRNPLTVLKMLYHSLNLDFAPDDPRARDFQIMGRKMDHLNKIVEQVLDFARCTEPQMAPVDLNRLIEDIGFLTRSKLGHNNIALIRMPARNLPLLEADSTQLEQAFLNLILNAVEAMPQGGQLTIQTRGLRIPADRSGYTHVLVEFRDTGHGMSPEQRAKALTSLLHTTKRTGTGLGLAIVSKIVEAHRGTIRIKSTPGKGTTFSIMLPV